MTDPQKDKNTADKALGQFIKNIEPEKIVVPALEVKTSPQSDEQYQREIIQEWANVPPEPAISKEEAQNKLNSLEHARIYNDAVKKDLLVNPEGETKQLFTKYRGIVDDHFKRQLYANKLRTHIQFPLSSMVVEKFCDISKTLIVVDATGELVAQHKDALQKFVDEGHMLTVFSTEAENQLTNKNNNIASVILSTEQIEKLKQSNIRNAIVGDGNDGCFFWEKTTKDYWAMRQAGVGPGAGLWFDMIKEDFINIFREQPIHQKRDAYQAAADAVPAFYETLTSFCHNQATTDLAHNINAAVHGPEAG